MAVREYPEKILRDFLGKPIIAYSIEAALELSLFDEVMVSTDDEEIAEIAKKYGAKVPFFRSKENADDHATLADVLLEVLDEYEITEQDFDNICCILPTAPFITSKRLNEAFDLLNNKEYLSIFPALEFFLSDSKKSYKK